MDSLSESWQSYFLNRCQTDVEALAEAFPSRRSLYVDLIDLHEFDSELCQSLFDTPDRVLSAGTAVLSDITDISRPIHVRVENNPHQCPVSAIQARHLHDLVTVEGVVESVASVRMTATRAQYDCPACDASTARSPAGIEVDAPARCDACGWDGQFTFRPTRSQFVDVQRLALAPRRIHDGRGHEVTPFRHTSLMTSSERSLRTSATVSPGFSVSIRRTVPRSSPPISIVSTSTRSAIVSPRTIPKRRSIPTGTHWSNVPLSPP